MLTKESKLAFVRPIGHQRAFEEILDQVDEAIAAGQLGPGDRFPPEREFAEQFGVSRTSVREALRVLEALGIVKVRRGPGPDNGVTILSEPTNALSRLLRLHVGLDLISVDDLMQFRILIESWAAETFALTRNPELEDELEGILREMGSASQEDFNELDTAFHVTLVRGAGNQIATLVTEGIREAIRHTMHDAFGRIRNWPPQRDRLVAEHSAIAAAIQAGEAADAARLVEEHIRGFWEHHRRRARK
jgi:DNA-binding FadR family transcriptional regulator